MKRKNSIVKRFLGLFIVFSMVISLVPVNAFSDSVNAEELTGAENYEIGNDTYPGADEEIIFEKTLISTEENNLVEKPKYYEDDDYDGYDEMAWDFDAPVVDPALSYKEARSMLVYDNSGDDRGAITDEDYSVPASYPYTYTNTEKLRQYLNEELTPLRDQGEEGSCWAHSAISLMENYILRNGKKDLNGTASIKSDGITPGINYSELQLAYFYYHNNTHPFISGQKDTITFTDQSFIDYGGNLMCAGQSMLNWRGAVDEALIPYNSKSLLSSSQLQAKSGISESFAYDDDTAHLTSAYKINLKENSKQVKEAIKENGAVGVSIYAAKSFYDKDHNSYYNYANSGSTNHAVNIVGWDDNFPASDFCAQSAKPSGNGAWLIRNSWIDTLVNPGEEILSYQGYFWLSYEDVSLSDVAFVYEADTVKYDYNYSYVNQVHNTASLAYTKFANVFTVGGTAGSSKERVDAVTLETFASDFEYTVSVCKTDSNGKPSENSGDVYTSQSGKIYYPGLYTIELKNPVTLNKGDKFAVVIETSREKCICEEYKLDKDGYNVRVYTNPGESFVYKNNKWVDWNVSSTDDFYGDEGNVCIQAFTTDVGNDGNQRIKGLTVTGRTQTSVTLKWDKLEDASSYCIYRTAGENYAYLDSFTKIKSGETSTTYTDTTIAKNSHCYYYVVPVIGGEKKAQASRTIAVEPVPSDDTTKTATIKSTDSKTNGRPIVYGADGSVGADGYRVAYRMEGTSSWTEADTDMIDFSSDGMCWVFYKEGLPSGKYEFTVKPYFVNIYGERRYGGETSGTFLIKFPAPENVRASYNSSANTVTLTWDPVEGAAGYKIYFPKPGSPNTYFTLGTTTDGECSFVVDKVINSSSQKVNMETNQTYNFYVYVYDPNIKNSDGKEDYSWNYSEEGAVQITTVPISIGDANEDGTIDAKDVTALRRYLAGGWNVTVNMFASDTNGDGSVDAKDVTQLRRYLAGGWGVVLGKN